MMKENIVMKRCIGLAQLAIGSTYPNPMVGSIITFDAKVIGEGYHAKAGKPHAEVNAVNDVSMPHSLSKAHLSVTLEPCAHHGRTPPCAEMIIQKEIRKVSIGIWDSHQKVNGKGVQILQKNGVEVVESPLQEECRRLNKRFFTFHEKKRPYIILKWAQSSDGFIDKDRKPYAISNSLVNQFVHTLRAHEHAIMIGKNTALNDNPSLTTRNIVGRNPVRIVLDKRLEIPKDFSLYQNEIPTIFINAQKEEIRGSLTFLKVSPSAELPEIMQVLHAHNIQSVLVEGGSHLLSECIRYGLWDEAIVIENENLRLEKGTLAPVFTEFPNNIKCFRDNTLRFYQNRKNKF